MQATALSESFLLDHGMRTIDEADILSVRVFVIEVTISANRVLSRVLVSRLLMFALPDRVTLKSDCWLLLRVGFESDLLGSNPAEALCISF